MAYDMKNAQDADMLANQIKYAYMYVEATANNICNSKFTRCNAKKEPPSACYGVSVARNPDDKDIWEVVADKQKLELVKTMGQMFIDGQSKYSICNFANESGYVSVKGNKLSTTSLTRMLQNPIYVGDYSKLKTKAGKLKTCSVSGIPEPYSRNEKNVDRKTVKGANFVEVRDRPLVYEQDVAFLTEAGTNVFTREEFNQIRLRIEDKKVFGDERSTHRSWGLSGKLYCECGVKMRGVKMANTGVPVYECSRERGGCKNRKKIKESDVSRSVMLTYYNVIESYPFEYLKGILRLRKEMLFSTEVRLKIREMNQLDDRMKKSGHKVADYVLNDWIEQRAKLHEQIEDGKTGSKFLVRKFEQEEFTVESEFISSANEFDEELVLSDLVQFQDTGQHCDNSSFGVGAILDKVGKMKEQVKGDSSFAIGSSLADMIIDRVDLKFAEVPIKRRKSSSSSRKHFEPVEVHSRFEGVDLATWQNLGDGSITVDLRNK
jgi:hypothetical protein